MENVTYINSKTYIFNFSASRSIYTYVLRVTTILPCEKCYHGYTKYRTLEIHWRLADTIYKWCLLHKPIYSIE